MNDQNRKTIRLKGYDYSSPGYYFVTICTLNKQKILCEIQEPDVGTVALDGPKIRMTKYGKIAEKHLQGFENFYPDIKLERYVIMPNHIHMLVHILAYDNGPSGATVPTSAKLSRFIGSIKRFCNREIGHNIWQYRSHDHIIRNEKDYVRIVSYIESNPIRWKEDKFYIPD